MKAMRFLALPLLLLAVGGCSSSPQRSFENIDLNITGLAIINRTQAYVTAAQLMVPATGNFVSCGNIAPGNICSTAFPEREFTGNPVIVSWTQGSRIHNTGELQVIPSDEVIEEGFAVVRVMIVGEGVAGLELLPRGADLMRP